MTRDIGAFGPFHLDLVLFLVFLKRVSRFYGFSEFFLSEIIAFLLSFPMMGLTNSSTSFVVYLSSSMVFSSSNSLNRNETLIQFLCSMELLPITYLSEDDLVSLRKG